MELCKRVLSVLCSHLSLSFLPFFFPLFFCLGKSEKQVFISSKRNDVSIYYFCLIFYCILSIVMFRITKQMLGKYEFGFYSVTFILASLFFPFAFSWLISQLSLQVLSWELNSFIFIRLFYWRNFLKLPIFPDPGSNCIP